MWCSQEVGMRQAEGGGLAWPMQPPLAASPTPTEAEPLSHPQRQQKKSQVRTAR